MLKDLRKVIAYFCISAFFLTFFTGCSNSQNEKDSSNVIKIGVNAELTGAVSTFGVSSTNGMKLAVKQINEAGGIDGKKIELVFADNKSEPSEAALAFTKLVTQDEVVAVLGPMISSTSLACTNIAEGNKVPMLTPSATNPIVTVNDGNVLDYVFRSCFIDDFMGSAMANFAYNSLNTKTAAILIDSSSDFSKGLAAVFEETFTKNGGKVLDTEAFLAKDTDFRATLTKIKALNPEVIFIPANYQEVGMIVKQARELDIKVPFVGVDAWDSPKLFEIAGSEALNNTYYPGHYSADDTSEVVQKFVQQYQAEYGTIPDTQAVLGYDSVFVIADAIKRAGSSESEKIRQALAETKDLQTVSGTITIDKNHNPIKGAVINENIDGKVIFKERVNP